MGKRGNDVHFGSIPEFINPEQYVEEKIKIFEEDFYISLSKEDKNYLYSLTNEKDINKACKIIIEKYL